MTLSEIKRAFDALSNEEQNQFRAYIEQQTLAEVDDMEIDRIRGNLVRMPLPNIQSGTMDVEALFAGLEEMTQGLSGEDVDDLVDTINQRSASRPSDIE